MEVGSLKRQMTRPIDNARPETLVTSSGCSKWPVECHQCNLIMSAERFSLIPKMAAIPECIPVPNESKYFVGKKCDVTPR